MSIQYGFASFLALISASDVHRLSYTVNTECEPISKDLWTLNEILDIVITGALPEGQLTTARVRYWADQVYTEISATENSPDKVPGVLEYCGSIPVVGDISGGQPVHGTQHPAECGRIIPTRLKGTKTITVAKADG